MILPKILLISSLILSPKEARMKKTLPNGIKILVAQKQGLPITQIYMAVEAGAIFDPKGKEGLANLTASLLDEGTKTRTDEEIALQIENVGGRLSINTGSYLITASLSVLSPYIDTGLDILNDIVRNPTFPEERFAREKERIISGIKEDLSDPNSVVDREFIQLVYEGHPLGHPTSGYLNTMESITRDDVLNFYKTHYSPDRTYIVAVSDKPVEETFKKIKDYFGDWKVSSTHESTEIPEVPEIRGIKVRVYHMPVNQVFVAMGHLGPLRKDPEFNKVRVMNYILGGGGFVSRMMKKIRVEKGYAYSTYTTFRPGITLPGFFEASMETKVETAHDAIKLMFEVIKELKEHGVTEQELKDAQSFYEGSIPRLTETYPQYASALFQELYYGLPENFWLKDVEDIKKFTVDDILSAARKYLHPDNFVMVLVADTSKFDVNKLNLSGADISIETPK